MDFFGQPEISINRQDDVRLWMLTKIDWMQIIPKPFPISGLLIQVWDRTQDNCARSFGLCSWPGGRLVGPAGLLSINSLAEMTVPGERFASNHLQSNSHQFIMTSSSRRGALAPPGPPLPHGEGICLPTPPSIKVASGVKQKGCRSPRCCLFNEKLLNCKLFN